MSGTVMLDWVGGNRTLTAVFVVLLLMPALASDFFVSFVMTQALLFGIAAASLTFLAAYGGMISLAQTLMFGFCGFVIGNAVTEGGSKGLNLGLDPWIGVILGIVLTVILAILLGSVASRSTGLYFLMITLTYGVIGFFFFGQVTTFSGFGGINQIVAPDYIGEPGDNPAGLYYTAVIAAVVVYALLRYVSTTPFGLALQGVRDDPVRMSALGYNLSVLRTTAFALCAFVASLGGVLFVWWNRQIDPASIGIGEILALLIIAVIGGINRLEGAWLGAFVFVVVNNYVRSVPLIDKIGITEARFNTVVGAIFLIIVVASPNGLMGLLERANSLLRGGLRSGPAEGVSDDVGEQETNPTSAIG